MKRWMLSFLLITTAGIYNANAQTKPLTLQECLQYAVSNNQRLALSRLEEEIGRQKTAEVRAQALPQVTANGNLTDNLKKQVLVLPGELTGEPGKTTLVEAGTTWNATASAELNQQLFNQSVFTGLKAARSGEEYYSLQTEQTKENVIYDVANLYYQLLVKKERMNVLDTNINKLTQLVATTKSQFENGLAKKIDLDRIKVNLVNYQTQKSQLVNQLKVQENQLKQKMGMPVATPIALPSLELSDIERKAAGTADFAGFNLENRTETRILRKTEELQTLQKKAYIAEYFPSLAFKGNYSYNGMSNKFDLFGGSGSTANWFSMASVGLTLRIPIFDGFARRSRVNQANITLQKVGKQLEENKINLNTSYENARLQMLNNLSTIRIQKENVSLADEVYYSTRNNYTLGLASLTDLLNAETSLAEAQNSYNEALLQYKLAELELIKSNGNLPSLLN
ncbi:TolC family protein [Chitinophaga sp. XS-30]|uniref:TolC family protein n=1 Tax=Chitinophaga sp. XS-30 TaxID=2604421 RepID=UPI0011DD5630|nr:TolC family protein [Chitinophaga sp. XS-30]QEH40054.1 TolC family protein [Chitinophaga sp. XS-30]